MRRRKLGNGAVASSFSQQITISNNKVLFSAGAFAIESSAMRITSGILGGRRFKVPKMGVRPTSERAREAVFSSVGERVCGARVLDLFAGAGGLSLEAWSRGAADVVAVEKISQHRKNLEQNFQSLAGDPDLGIWSVVQADVYTYLQRAPGAFDLIFADPPYDEADLQKVLELVGDALAPGGLLIFELRKRTRYEVPSGWELVKDKNYGGTKVLFLKAVES